MVRVLFVCMGNICRSPMAEGTFTKLVRDHGLGHLIEVDSAGTHAYHEGEAPDRRAQETAARRGVDLSGLRARRVVRDDLEYYDYVLVMDRENYRALQRIAPPEHAHKVRLFMDFAPHLEQEEVPDPYYGAQTGFDRVLDLVDAAARGLLIELRKAALRRPEGREEMGGGSSGETSGGAGNPPQVRSALKQ